ncbi:MAG: hypothetical protein AABY18_00230 [Candidatus Thermoplasmatota archaeon]
MSSKRLLAFAVLLLLGAIPVEVGAQAAGVEYRLIVTCGGNVPIGQPATPVTTGGGGCPVRAVDGDDLMGDPSLAVDPLQPQNLILASLHGPSAGSEGPTPRARQCCPSQPFTTFTSQNQGANWVDNPFVPPDEVGNALGIHPQVTIDPYGQVYVGSLYAMPSGTDGNGTNTFDYVIAAQKFESIETIDEEQASSNGGYNAEYITPIHEENQINQMWFLFNPITDNMTLVWHETVFVPPVPPCDTDTAYLVDVGGNYVKANPLTQQVALYQESNGVPDLQTPESCPANPDNQFIAAPTTEAASPQVAVQPAPAPAPAPAGSTQAAPPVPGLASSIAVLPTAQPTVTAVSQSPVPMAQPTRQAATSPPPAPAPSAAPAAAQPDSADDDEDTPRGTIGIAWTTSDSDTPYYYQDTDDAIAPCSGSTNPVLSFGWLYVGCIVDTSEGEFRWAPEVANGTVQLFRMDPNGGKPEYMGQAPDMVGPPKLGVRSDGRLALVAAGASTEGALQFSAAFGRYETAAGRIDWTKQLALGHDILPLDPEVQILRGNIQDIVYREQSGALHVIVKTTVNYLAGSDDLLDGLGLAPHIQKMIVALDEDYGVLATLKLDIGDPLQRNQDATILQSPEAAFQDLSDDFLLLPAEPFTYNGTKLGNLYQREFFAIADYGTVLFAEVIEITDLKAPGTGFPPSPPPPIPAAATTNLVAPVAGVLGASAVLGSLVAHRRKNPLAAITKGE